MRRRIQVAIDRQFYRKRYDAAQIAQEFAASLRTELDLNELSQHLVEVAHRAMKPKHVSLWLAPQQARAESESAQPRQSDDLAQSERA
jgi:hypothetical protein